MHVGSTGRAAYHLLGHVNPRLFGYLLFWVPAVIIRS